MVIPSGPRSHPTALTDRHSERGVLDALLDAVRAGEAGYWCCAAIRAWARQRCWTTWPGGAAGCRVVRVLGMQSEMELAFAGLHQLCAPMLHRLGRLPVPQRARCGPRSA